MTCIPLRGGGFLCAHTAPDHVIEAGGRRWTFEMHNIFGPAVTGKRGQILATQPGDGSAFWDAVTLWDQQGRRVGADGLCIWDPPPDPMVACVACCATMRESETGKHRGHGRMFRHVTETP